MGSPFRTKVGRVKTLSMIFRNFGSTDIKLLAQVIILMLMSFTTLHSPKVGLVIGGGFGMSSSTQDLVDQLLKIPWQLRSIVWMQALQLAYVFMKLLVSPQASVINEAYAFNIQDDAG